MELPAPSPPTFAPVSGNWCAQAEPARVLLTPRRSAPHIPSSDPKGLLRNGLADRRVCGHGVERHLCGRAPRQHLRLAVGTLVPFGGHPQGVVLGPLPARIQLQVLPLLDGRADTARPTHRAPRGAPPLVASVAWRSRALPPRSSASTTPPQVRSRIPW